VKTPVSPLIHGERTSIEEHWEALAATIEPHPRVRVVDSYANAASYRFRLNDVKLLAILEVEHHDDSRHWAHLSVSAQSPLRLPTWPELLWAKRHFLGDRRAIQVLPPKGEYVNIKFNVLNLYACLDGEPLPDFRMKDQVTGQIGI
jgi:hypothetical protein